MVPHSSTLAWKIPWTAEPGGLQSVGSLQVGHDWVTSLSLSCIGEGNGNPLQCSCLENPRDGGAWLAAVYGIAQSWTWLKWLSSSSSSSSSIIYSEWHIISRESAFWNIIHLFYTFSTWTNPKLKTIESEKVFPYWVCVSSSTLFFSNI